MVVLTESWDLPCLEARNLAYEQLQQVRSKSSELQESERSIAAFVDSCDQSCAGSVA